MRVRIRRFHRPQARCRVPRFPPRYELATFEPLSRSRRAAPTLVCTKASCLVFCPMTGERSRLGALSSVVQPFPSSKVLWPRLTSAVSSRHLAMPVARPLATGQISRDKRTSIAPRLLDLPHADLGITGFSVCCQFTHRVRPSIQFLSVRSWLWLGLPSDPTSR